jgi:seryl-tRNA synthetase
MRGTGVSDSTFRDLLVSRRLLYPSSVPGVYSRSGAYERIASGLEEAIGRLGAGQFEVVHAPPILARETFDRTDYLRSFPHLMGSLHVFTGDDAAHADLVHRYAGNGPWQEMMQPAETVLSSAACHAVYPMCSGALPEGGRRIEVSGFCFRHEPSSDPARMQSFRMHELVRVDEPDAALLHRDRLLADGLTLLADLGLDMRCEVANDPFFGRIGAIMTETQLVETTKLEGLTTVASEAEPTAIISGNYALDHFTSAFSIECADGGKAHSSCVGFGIDRVVLALLRRHGTTSDRWPTEVRSQLWP